MRRGFCRISSVLLSALFVLLSLGLGYADVRPHGLFSDGMVLQRGAEIPVWGTADDGEEVEVTFCGQTVTTVSEGGKWMVRLQPLKAGGPFTMRISGANVVKVQDVLVGEVWVCGGQSNMVQPVNNSANGEQEVADSENPTIRLLKVPEAHADSPIEEVNAPWKRCEPGTVRGFSAVAYFFGREIQSELAVPVGLIQSCVGGTPAEAWMSMAALRAIPAGQEYVDSYDRALKAYETAKAKQEAESEGRPGTTTQGQGGRKEAPGQRPSRLPGVPRQPSELYNGMIAPLQPYAIRGVIWYQGEANAGNPKRALDYRTVFPALITCWRKDWGHGEFPFLFVQLAAYRAREGSDWPLLRESQTMTLALRNTGMAVAIDAGEEGNIHPRRKQPVGHRLALAARAIAYGEDIPYSGPVYDGMETRGDSIVISFKHADGGLVAKGGELKGFSVAGPDGQFVDAVARIDGDKVIVSSADVAEPTAVRYGWSDYPTCNFYNGADLPAVPFRTDGP